MNNILVVSNLSKNFGNHKVLENVSFKVPRGKVIGLVGPNGAGKSTIMKCILGIYPYSQGDIWFEGRKMTAQTTGTMGKKIGALVESPAIYPFLTGMKHFKLYGIKPADRQRVIHLLGMENYINQKVTQYSFGMKQKLGIALALVNNPDLVILDEPMNGLDLMSTLAVRKIIISQAAKGPTFIVSSHILSELEKIITDVVLIDHGKIILQKPLQALREAGHQCFTMVTNRNSDARQLLGDHHFDVSLANDQLQIQISPNQLTGVLQILLDNHIVITNVSHQGMDLETATLQFLKQAEGAVNHA